MEALLCDEAWLMSPPTTDDDHQNEHEHNKHDRPRKGYTTTTTTSIITNITCTSFFYTTKEDCDYAFTTCLLKELHHMPQPGYIQSLKSNHPLANSRFKAIHWLLRSQCQFTLSFQTVFNAANYLDRFISMNQCHGWKYWMFELLSVACLSISCKFGETAPLPFHEMQEGLDHSFEAGLILRMELTLLKALGWVLNCATPYSYVELITWEMNLTINPHLVQQITTRLVQLLATSLLDYKFLAFRPCIIATTGLRCLLKELLPSTCDVHVAHVTTLIPQDQRENLIKCDKLFMEEILVERFDKLHAYGQSLAYHPSSPVTVLTKALVQISDQQVDFSLFKMPATLNNISLVKSGEKRKREENECCVDKL